MRLGRKSHLVWVLIIFSLWLFSKSAKLPNPRQFFQNTAIIDKSVKAEAGKPIKVAKVLDGDTVELINGERLRYIGIDSPEELDNRKPVQCFAFEAAERNRQLVEGKEIIFQKDSSKFDKYGRWLGFVYLMDGTFVNEELVLEGFAFSYPYPPDTSKEAIFGRAEETARSGSLGLWAACTVSTLSSGRKQTNSAAY